MMGEKAESAWGGKKGRQRNDDKEDQDRLIFRDLYD